MPQFRVEFIQQGEGFLAELYSPEGGALVTIENCAVYQSQTAVRAEDGIRDLKMNRLFERIDTWATAQGLEREVDPPHLFEPTQVAFHEAGRPTTV